MKKLKQYKGFIFAVDRKDEETIHIYTREEWSYGEGCRYPEYEAGSIQEAKDFVDSY